MRFTVSHEGDTGFGGWRVFDDQGDLVGGVFGSRTSALEFVAELTASPGPNDFEEDEEDEQ